MNKIEQTKQQLKTKGFTTFNIKDYNEDFYNFLLEFKCNETKNLKNKMNSLRFDSNGMKISKTYATFDIAKEVADEALGQMTNEDLIGMAQMWYYNEVQTIMEDENKQLKFKYFINSIYDMVNHLYDTDYELEFHATQFTYYPKDSFLTEHSDGYATGRICALLIYLNETYDEKDGGYLILDKTEKVLPIFGNVAVIDLQTYDVKHEVTKVTGGIGRYAILSFVKKAGNPKLC
jgi:Rps23 Pro-64 3,4-dihydroxylase Tpa1-like proline 4-hydroxylase